MPITPLPAAPSRADPANFSNRADALLGALPTMVTEFNASMAGESAAALAANLANPASGKGPALIALNQSVNYVHGTLGAQFSNGPMSVMAHPWLATGDGSTDDTSKIQACINFCKTANYTVWLPTPSVSYLVTDTIRLYNGSNIKGEQGGGFTESFTLRPRAAFINFTPTTVKDLFTVENSGAAIGIPFIFHCAVSGLYLEGGANARYAFNLSTVIYSTFENVGTLGFSSAFYIDASIHNRYKSISTKGATVACVQYVATTNVPTTDKWEHCTFFSSKIGVLMSGASVSIEFNSCIFEQLVDNGMIIPREAQCVTVNNCYAEDVPYGASGSSNRGMFAVGFTGSVTSSEFSLSVAGGKYAGRTSGTTGSFLLTDHTNGVQLLGVTHSRYTEIITTTANTRASSINVFGGSGIGWATYTNNMQKICGLYPNGVNNSGVQTLESRVLTVNTNTILAADGNGSGITISGAAILLSPGVSNSVYPSGNGTVNLGIPSNLWATVYASTGAINTSDGREKTAVRGLTPSELAASKDLAREIGAYKFLSAVAEKGLLAREHIGMTVQRAIEILTSHGLDAMSYGFICFDEWSDTVDEHGSIVRQRGDRYGFRVDELLLFISAGIEARIYALENQ